MRFEQRPVGRVYAGDEHAGDEQTLRAQFWIKAKRVAGNAAVRRGSARRLLLRVRRDTPAHVKVTLLGALAYFVLPVDVVPDVLPLIGFTDDAAVLATAIKLVAQHMRPEHRAAARQALAGGLSEQH